jgi:hypothetical protein
MAAAAVVEAVILASLLLTGATSRVMAVNKKRPTHLDRPVYRSGPSR